MISTANLPKKIACETLKVNRLQHYRCSSQNSNFDDLKIKKMIETIIKKFPRYGYKRVTKQLHRQKTIINHKRVYRIMSKHNLLYNMKKKFKLLRQIPTIIYQFIQI